ncbi:MAG TPA: amino acid permease [Gemmatimonadales bacterium]|nr:amino acid permease [Gemmatimonadales bacterium]
MRSTVVTHDDRNLTRAIGLLPATSMVVGIIVGASIFVQPSLIAARTGSASAVATAWLAAGLLTLAGALVAAELASAFPRSGGVYVFLKEAWSPAAGFTWGWAMLWTMHSGIIAAIAVVFARYLARLAPLEGTAVQATAITAVAVLTTVNVIGVRAGARVQSSLTVLKVALVVGLAAVLLFAPAPTHTSAATAVSAWDWALAVGAGLFAFGGWHMVTYAAEETVDAARTIPRALAIGVAIVTACYLALNAAYLRVLPLEALAASRSVAADAVAAVAGARGATVVALVVAISALGALNGVVLAGPRVYYAMAADGLAFRWLAGVHGRFHTPHRALILQGLVASALIATGTYEQLFGRVIYTEWLFFALMAIGLVRLRGRPGYAPPWRMPAAPYLPLLFALASLAVAARQIAVAPLDSAIGLAIAASGIPIYFMWIKFRKRSSP